MIRPADHTYRSYLRILFSNHTFRSYLMIILSDLILRSYFQISLYDHSYTLRVFQWSCNWSWLIITLWSIMVSVLVFTNKLLLIVLMIYYHSIIINNLLLLFVMMIYYHSIIMNKSLYYGIFAALAKITISFK